MTSLCAVVKVCSVKGEEERSQNCSLWDPRTADNRAGYTAQRPHTLLAVGDVVHNPAYETVVHLCGLHSVPQECMLYCIESTAKIKERDSHSASRLLQVRKNSVEEEDDSTPIPSGYFSPIQGWNFHAKTIL